MSSEVKEAFEFAISAVEMRFREADRLVGELSLDLDLDFDFDLDLTLSRPESLMWKGLLE